MEIIVILGIVVIVWHLHLIVRLLCRIASPHKHDEGQGRP